MPILDPYFWDGLRPAGLLLADAGPAPGKPWDFTWQIWGLPGELVVLLPLAVAGVAAGVERLAALFVRRRSDKAAADSTRSKETAVASEVTRARSPIAARICRAITAPLRWRTQFSLWTMLWLTPFIALISIVAGTGRWAHIFIPALPISLVATYVCCVAMRVKHTECRRLAVVVVAAVAYGALHYRCPALETWEISRADRYIASQIDVVRMAIRDYYDAHHCYPPACIRDGEGRPMHSWRVLILPFLDPSLYARYRFDEPWNGPHNSQLAGSIPNRFSGVYGETSRKWSTCFVAVVGADTLLRDTNNQSIPDGNFPPPTDSSRSVIELVEAPDLEINWMEPRDLTPDALVDLLTQDARVRPSFMKFHSVGPNGQPGYRLAGASGPQRCVELPCDLSANTVLMLTDVNAQKGFMDAVVKHNMAIPSDTRPGLVAVASMAGLLVMLELFRAWFKRDSSATVTAVARRLRCSPNPSEGT